MKYFVSDIHGEYELFQKLLAKIKFSDDDEMYICGDMMEKGDSSVKLMRLISSFSNMHCVIGNHELAFLKYYHAILERSPTDFDRVLAQLQGYFPEDGHLLDWELVDWLEGLPAYIEEDTFICVHAGIPLDEKQRLLPLDKVSVEQLMHDRHFKDPKVTHNSPKCVFFGHTQTDCVCGDHKILGYQRNEGAVPDTIADYYKIHLDTGAWRSGVLGCVCSDTLRVYYVKKQC